MTKNMPIELLALSELYDLEEIEINCQINNSNIEFDKFEYYDSLHKLINFKEVDIEYCESILKNFFSVNYLH